MSEQPLLSVRGEAELEVEPEIAQLYVTLQARDHDRAKTLRQMDERATATDAILARFADAVERVETAAVRVSPEFKNWRPGERIVGYLASVSQTVTVAATAFDRLGELLAQLADQDLAQVNGPYFSLRPGSAEHRRARAAAVHDALQRARDYAGAVGSELTGLVELADSDLLSEGRGGPQLMGAQMAPMARSRSAAPEEFAFDITPALQTVYASVEARFRMTAPDLAAGPAAAAEGS